MNNIAGGRDWGFSETIAFKRGNTKTQHISTHASKEVSMAFSDQIKLQRYSRANGRCECVRHACGHLGRCVEYLAQPVRNPDPVPPYTTSVLSQMLFGRIGAFSYPGFQFHHVVSQVAGGSDSLANSEFVCISCHQNTRSFGTNLTRR